MGQDRAARPDPSDPFQGLVEVAVGAVRLELQYETKSNVPTYWMVGKVVGAEDGTSGMTVEVRRLDGGWESDPIAVDETGLFQVELPLIVKDKPHRTRFACQLKDDSGQLLCAVLFRDFVGEHGANNAIDVNDLMFNNNLLAVLRGHM